MLNFQYYWPILSYFLTSLHIAAGFLILLLTSHWYIFCSGIMFPLAQEFTFILCVCVCVCVCLHLILHLRISLLCCFPSLCKDKVLLAHILFLFCKLRSRFLFFVFCLFVFFSIMLAVKFMWASFSGFVRASFFPFRWAMVSPLSYVCLCETIVLKMV